MQFQVNGQDYFLAFVEEDRNWYVLAATEQGVQRIPVYHDVEKYERMGLPEKTPQKRVN